MKKIIGFCIVTLLIGTAVLPALGTINKIDDSKFFSSNKSEIQWSKTYGGDEADKFWDVDETDDGGYIAIGTTEESGNNYPWVVKVDSDGNEMWDWSINEFTVDGEVLEISYCWQSNVFQISDGGYIISLSALETTYNDEVYDFGGIAKLGSNGDEEWMIIQGDGFEWNIRNEYLLEVEDGILGVGDYINPLDTGEVKDTSGCLFKINNNGELEWHKEYEYGDFVDKLNCIYITDDGGFLIAGGVGIVADVYWDGWLVKTDSQGEKEWEKTFSGPKNDFFWGCIQTDDGDYMMVGWTDSFGFGSMDAWVLKTDSDGNEIWNKTFGEKGYDIPYSYDITDNGKFIFPCTISVTGINTYNWIVKMDNNGNAEWKHIYNEATKQYFVGICSTSDGGCIASGILGTWDSRGSDALLVKYAPMENQRPNKPTINGPDKGQPYVEFTFTASSTDPDGDSISYMWDWGDGNLSDWLDTKEVSYTWNTEDNFKIRVITRDEHGGESEWSDPFTFSTPKIKVSNFFTQIMERFIQRFPILEFLI